MDSPEASDVASNEGRFVAKALEGAGEGIVALIDVGVEAVVRGHAPCGFPYTFGGIELG
jgi:hypothetical protein